MRLATWNVNSVRARSERIAAWLTRSEVDVLAIQETKCRQDQFPTEVFTELGYTVAHHGHSQWNGVAIASRVGLEEVRRDFPGQPTWKDEDQPEARAIGARCGGVDVWSLYVPNGRELDDPHYVYKLDWLAALRTAGTAWLEEDPAARIALCGDFNVAPEDTDVWDMAEFEGSTHVSPAERDAFAALVEAGFTDTVRPFAPGPGVYTYWDYKGLAFPKRKGMRIDFVLASPALAAQVADGRIDREERKGKGPSDHAPVIVDLSTSG
ncbi:exodeoxyribonuclease III [Lipingzhangella sp. LS1_29]|uniref:Exodeoxyribonuclease III n=1 Tax=Lipingzhangella rawalii TaxID=2055835 RepID=A0ABU2H5K8_9ACTN|nr:exodeoxyribonuclease III [Lipingzhangella rawalii]MDS1270287.1 exodeoxyribonuclease III [Lipingzhangella rawalii]